MGVIQALYPNNNYKDKEKNVRTYGTKYQLFSGSAVEEPPRLRTSLTVLALILALWFVTGLAFSGKASAQETTVTFDATMAGPTTAATMVTPTATTSTTPVSQPTESTDASTGPSAGGSTEVYPTQQTTYQSTSGTDTLGPSTTGSTVYQPAATTPMSQTTPYAETTTSVGYPSMPDGQLMNTGGFGLRSVLIGAALSLIAGGSMLYTAFRARSNSGGY